MHYVSRGVVNFYSAGVALLFMIVGNAPGFVLTKRHLNQNRQIANKLYQPI
jgi:hypothetical protein